MSEDATAPPSNNSLAEENGDPTTDSNNDDDNDDEDRMTNRSDAVTETDDPETENNHSLPEPPSTTDGENGSLYGRARRTFSSFNKRSVSSVLLVTTFGLLSLAASVLVVSRYPVLPVMTLDRRDGRYNELDKDSTLRDVDNTRRYEMDQALDGHLTSSVKGPKIVWFFAWPQSGGAHQLHLLHKVSQRATATNYGHVLLDPKGVLHRSVRDSVRLWGDAGPALFSGDVLPPPDKYVLTWTATDGACRNCHPRRYMYNTKRFRELCWHGTVLSNRVSIPFRYDPDRVAATVHMTRHPLDNVVLRFWAEREEKAAEGHRTFLATFPPDAQGFAAWCAELDAEWEGVERAWYGDDVFAAAADVPCRQEFYKYASFHNNVVRLREGARLPVMNVRYEDLAHGSGGTTNYHKTVGRLLTFLELPVSGHLPEKDDVKVNFSRDYFTDGQRAAIFRFLEKLALPSVVKIVRDYRDMTF